MKFENFNEEITSAAKASLFISPPDIPLTLPGKPIVVSAHLVRPS